MAGVRVLNRQRIGNPVDSPAYKAGFRWYMKKYKTAKGSFLVGPGADQYLKSQGLEGTKDLDKYGYQYEPSVRARIERAKEMYSDFIDGADRAHENRLHQYDEDYTTYRPNPIANPALDIVGTPEREAQETAAEFGYEPYEKSIVGTAYVGPEGYSLFINRQGNWESSVIGPYGDSGPAEELAAHLQAIHGGM